MRVYDNAAYPIADEDFGGDPDSPYAKICQGIKGDDQGFGNPLKATIALEGRGVASRTFLGDGSYGVFVVKNEAGQAIGATLVYDGRDPAFLSAMDEPSEDEEVSSIHSMQGPDATPPKAAMPAFIGMVGRELRVPGTPKHGAPGRKKGRH